MAFDGPSFIKHIAQRLVQEFEFSAGAGTPGLIGAAKEHPARVQLERLMPEGIAVGSGIVVDSYGGVSRQQDIIIYEKLCPVFTHNGAPEATYYPVEGVIAAGEVKSSLGKSEITDAFEKSRSVKALRRHSVATDDGLGYSAVGFRNYGLSATFAGCRGNEFNQDAESLHQIFTFILCEKFISSPETTVKNAADLFRDLGLGLGPNFICSLRDGFIVPYNSAKNSITRAPMEADGLMFCDQPNDSFSQLLSMIRIYVNSGKTVERGHYERYFRPLGHAGDRLRIAAKISF
jgi:hypothetical protein